MYKFIGITAIGVLSYMSLVLMNRFPVLVLIPVFFLIGVFVKVCYEDLTE